MLVLSRTVDQIIRIGDDIELTVVSISGDKVRIGITAPEDVTIHRQEVYVAIQREKQRGERNSSQPQQDAYSPDNAGRNTVRNIDHDRA